MIPGTRYLLADHYFHRYFDLGRGFDPRSMTLLGNWAHSLPLIEAFTIQKHSGGVPQCLAAAKRIYEFTTPAPLYALGVYSEEDEDYRLIVDYLDYEFSGSRYDWCPSSLQRYPGRRPTIIAALPGELSKCLEYGVSLYRARTGESLLLATEALRR